jgi:hypothetical protein
MLCTAFSRVGNYLINVERARIASQVSALASVYGGEAAAREVIRLNHATLCSFSAPTSITAFFEVCADVEGTQRQAHAVDTWSNSVPTLEP